MQAGVRITAHVAATSAVADREATVTVTGMMDGTIVTGGTIYSEMIMTDVTSTVTAMHIICRHQQQQITAKAQSLEQQ